MAPGIWAPEPRRMELLFTKEEKTTGETGEQRELKALVRDKFNRRYLLDIWEKAAEHGFEVQWRGLDRKSNLGSLVCTKIFLTAGSLFKICVQDWSRGSNHNHSGKKTDKEEELRIKNQAVKGKVLSCLTLCDPMDYTCYGILEWVAFPFSRGSSQPRDRTRSIALQVPHLLEKKKKIRQKTH